MYKLSFYFNLKSVPDILGPEGNINVEKFLNGQGIGLNVLIKSIFAIGILFQT